MVYIAHCSIITEKSEEKPSNAQPSASDKKDSEKKQESEKQGIPDPVNWGYDLYPERRGDKYKPSWTGVIFGGEGREQHDRLKCEENVYNCVKNSPLVKLMLGALKSSGCAVDIRRHIACEVCDPSVSGGYDPVLNQVVVCQNIARSKGMVQGVLTHEMIHMFDYCRNNLDFKNIDHLACTEIRAANLTHCSFLSAWHQGDASPFRVQRQHQECVKTKAMQSVLAVRNVTEEDARAAVNRVFSRCYNDLEPIGRRLRRNSLDIEKAYMEAPFYGSKCCPCILEYFPPQLVSIDSGQFSCFPVMLTKKNDSKGLFQNFLLVAYMDNLKPFQFFTVFQDRCTQGDARDASVPDHRTYMTYKQHPQLGALNCSENM